MEVVSLLKVKEKGVTIQLLMKKLQVRVMSLILKSVVDSSQRNSSRTAGRG